MRIYYTQLIYLKEGKEEVFHRFEDHVLPLLGKHHGELVLRWRKAAQGVIGSSADTPYEVHLVSFRSKEDFISYANDDERRAYLSLREESIEKVLLIEGHAI